MILEKEKTHWISVLLFSIACLLRRYSCHEMSVFLHINCHWNRTVDKLQVSDVINLLVVQSIVLYVITVTVEMPVL